jgi:hypothetical protein
MIVDETLVIDVAPFVVYSKVRKQWNLLTKKIRLNSHLVRKYVLTISYFVLLCKQTACINKF